MYCYEVSVPVPLPDGEDDFTIDIDVQRFDSFCNAKAFALRNGGEIELVLSNGDRATI